MPAKLASVSFDLNPAPDRRPQTGGNEPSDKFNMVVLGDFSGRASRGIVASLTAGKLLPLDVDNCERLFAQLGAVVRLTGAGISDGALELPLTTLGDFHPDRLLAGVPSLSKLAEARQLVLNPATAEQGKAALQAYLGAAIAAPTATPVTPVASSPETDDDTMARLLGGKPLVKQSPGSVSQLEQFIRQVVAPHVSSSPGSWQSGALAAADMELTQRLNAILHHPDFQAVEAAWRGVDLLVRRIESSEEIGLFIHDVSPAELQADLAASGSVEQSALFRLLRDRQPRMLVGNFTFGQGADDLQTLGKLAEIAARLSAPFVASAAPHLVGCDSFARHPDPHDWKLKLPADLAEIWETLRQSPPACYVGLAAPRFLLRQPYGKSGDPIDTFPFEELPGEPAHESFLWGHSGVLVACAAVDAIQSGDLQLSEFTGGEISDLPVHKHTQAGEIVVKSYAEAWLTDRAVDRLLARGVLPVVPVKHQNTIRLNQLSSVAVKPARLPFA